MDSLRKGVIQSEVTRGQCLFTALDVPRDLAEVVAEWQRLAWYTIEGSPNSFVHNIGVKPSDPTTDVLFALAFYSFHQKLLDKLKQYGLDVVLPIHGKGSSLASLLKRLYIWGPLRLWMIWSFLLLISVLLLFLIHQSLLQKIRRYNQGVWFCYTVWSR